MTIAICTVCRQENGVRCPECACDAIPIKPPKPRDTSEPAQARQTKHEPLYRCASDRCRRHQRPFYKHEGGITHERHLRCPPTNRLELLQPDPNDLEDPESEGRNTPPIPHLTPIDLIDRDERREEDREIPWPLLPEEQANQEAELDPSADRLDKPKGGES